MPDLTLDLSDNGRTVSVSPGSRVALNLQENPTTGFQWEAPAADTDVASLENDTFTPHGTAAGGGGVRHFLLHVKKHGETTIRLAKRRPWEKDGMPDSTFELTIKAEPAPSAEQP